ncbi:hypothetical protein F5879DRAFT_995056 [Lentinula edodes]|nr:hypothetical protein F5879DRAFT_995056 [Lentinula edodes]
MQSTAWKTPPVLPIIGAVTDKLDVAEYCYRTGVPVWLVRPLGSESAICVLRWLDEVDPIPVRSLEKFCSFEDATPMNKVIYSGQLGNLERYRYMAEYSWGQAFPSLYGPEDLSQVSYDDPSSVTTRPAAPLHSSAVASLAGPSRCSTSPKATRKDPYPKNFRSKPSSNHRKDRNKFMEVTSPLLPNSIPDWVVASEHVGKGFNQNQKARSGVPRGYFLPEPALFANHSSDMSRQAYFSTYLKVREIILYRLRTLGASTCLKSSGEWRKLLGLELHGLKIDTKCASTRQKLVNELQQGLEMSNSLTLDLSDLQNVVPRWQNKEVAGRIPDDICRQVLHEIYTISFKAELLLADQYLYELQSEGFDGDGKGYDELDASSREDRKIKVMSFMPGFTTGVIGFGSGDQGERQRSIYALYKLMCSWTRVPSPASDTHNYLVKLEPKKYPSRSILDHAERLVAYHYIISFADFFKRAPVLPHVL